MISEKEALKLFEKYGVPQRIIEHCKAVTLKATGIAKQLNSRGVRVDTKKLNIAALLHDVGRVRCLAGEGNPESFEKRHEPESIKILEAEGLHEIAELVAKHGFQALFLEPKNLTLEEKILIYADLTVTESGVSTLDERFEYLMKKYAKQDVRTKKAFEENWHKIKAIEKELKELGGI